MCNCGNKRMEFSQQASTVNQPPRMRTQQTVSSASFEYTGKTALTVVGHVTGKQYRFSHPGNRQNIDYRDIPGLTGIPVLKKIT